MNKRIEELADEAAKFSAIAALLAALPTGEPADKLFVEKFAELIVKECAKVAFDDWCEGTNESSSEMAILKHFGVK